MVGAEVGGAVGGAAPPAAAPALAGEARFIQLLTADFRHLSLETRKKHPQIRESCDEAIEKLTLAASNPQTSLYGVVNQILYPLVQGCESKDTKIIKFCLGTMQRLIAGRGVDARGARHVVDCLATLAPATGLEPRLLQTAALLLTTSDLVRGDTLARTLVVCLRLQGTPGGAQHAAGATVRQLVSLVFERATLDYNAGDNREINPADARPQNAKAPKDLRPCAADAYLMFQDIVQLVNGDQPHWLVGVTEISKTFGLELLETVLTDFSDIFFKITDFRFLLKEHVCALIIRLFSPNVKFRSGIGGAMSGSSNAGNANIGSGGAQTTPGHDRPHFPVSMRLLRMVSVIVHKYHSMLVTECEIFLSLTIKFLDPDKPLWQRALALEVLHKMSIRPELLTSFCECYDLRPHATNIFQDIVNSLGAYLQSLFVASQVNTTMGMTTVPQQNGFFWKGIWLPLCTFFPPGTAKWTYLEMLDRTEAPQVQDGYGISVAFACLIEVVRSVALTVGGPEYLRDQDYETSDFEIRNNERNTSIDLKKDLSPSETDKPINTEFPNVDNKKVEEDDKCHTLQLQLVQSSWCGLVWGLSVLAEASVGELELVLRAIHTMARVSAKVGHNAARDACAGALCRAALPAHYPLAALGALPGPRPSQSSIMSNSGSATDPDPRHQVVAVGTPLPSTAPPPGQPGWVVVTGRQVTGLRALLRLAALHGAALQQAWLPVLTTLQHLVWILGLKPSTGGSLKAGRAHTDSHALMSTAAVMADLPMLSGLVSKVFESSGNLDPDALQYLLDALCKLSNEAMELAYSNREPSLFAVAKLLETGLANLHRVEIIWRPLTAHLFEVCQHPHIRMREWGVEAITYLVKSAFHYKFKNPDQGKEKLEVLLVEPLGSLSSIQHADVRQRQLECVSQLLHSHGQALSAAYPQLLHIVAAIADHHSPVLVRSAFQCLQVICAELVAGEGAVGGASGGGGAAGLRRAAAAAARFARQSQDLNVSLTAVGLMWNISDYFYQNQERLHAILSEDNSVYPEFPGTVDLPQFEKLWMCLYIRLGELCTEGRPSVRRAACQTLFSCINAHGGSLQPAAWRPLLWAVLFPMLHKVQNQANMASSEKVDTGEHILIHHSRNTAQKQWAETQVLALSGVARVFHTKHQVLQGLGDFARAWAVLLDFIQNFALCQNHEVSVGSLKSFQEVLLMKRCPDVDLEREVCSLSWQVWIYIAREASSANQRIEQLSEKNCTNNKNNVSGSNDYIPSQAFLTALVQIFPTIFQNIKMSFSGEDLTTLGSLLEQIIIVSSHSPQSIVDTGSVSLLHSAVLHCLELLQQEAVARPVLLPALFSALLRLARLGWGGVGSEGTSCAGPSPSGDRALSQAVRLYQTCATLPQVTKANILNDIVLILKECAVIGKKEINGDIPPPAPLPALLQTLEAGLPLARKEPSQYSNFWNVLPSIIECFMFDARVEDERLCCELVMLVRSEVLPHAAQLPRSFLVAIVALLNRGSIHTAFTQGSDCETELKMREEFARTCFETLLQFSLLEDIESITTENGELAVAALLERFGEAVRNYRIASSQADLPKARLSEISFVLKAIATLMDSMKKAPKGKVDKKAWEKLIGLYPELVECAAGNGGIQIATPLKETLLHYADLLSPPTDSSSFNRLIFHN